VETASIFLAKKFRLIPKTYKSKINCCTIYFCKHLGSHIAQGFLNFIMNLKGLMWLTLVGVVWSESAKWPSHKF